MAYSPGTPFVAGYFFDMVSHDNYLYASGVYGGMQKFDPVTAAVVDSGPAGGTRMIAAFGSIWCLGDPGMILRVDANDLSSYVEIPLIIDGDQMLVGFGYGIYATSDSIIFGVLGPEDMIAISAATNIPAFRAYPHPGAFSYRDDVIRSDSNCWSVGLPPGGSTPGVNKWDPTAQNFITHFPLGNIPGEYNAVGYGSGKIWSYTEDHQDTPAVYPYLRNVEAHGFVQMIDPATDFVADKIEIPFQDSIGGSNSAYDDMIRYGTKEMLTVQSGHFSVWFFIRHTYPGVGYYEQVDQMWQLYLPSMTFTNVWPATYNQTSIRGVTYEGMSTAVTPMVYLQPEEGLMPFFIAADFSPSPSPYLNWGIYRLYGSPNIPPPPPPPVSTAGIFIKDYRIGGNIGT
jgi:hypothetical protein